MKMPVLLRRDPTIGASLLLKVSLRLELVVVLMLEVISGALSQEVERRELE